MNRQTQLGLDAKQVLLARELGLRSNNALCLIRRGDDRLVFRELGRAPYPVFQICARVQISYRIAMSLNSR